MLVISRRIREAIEVGPDIRVTVLAIRSDQVRLGVLAPREVSVLRSELLERVRLSNEAAAQLEPAELLGKLTPAAAAMRVSWPVADPAASQAFYAELGFQPAPPGTQARLLLRRGEVELELKPGTPLRSVGLCLSSHPTRWLVDPNGYSIGL
ncbi:carbon storage regulator [bacterium]|nr:carbon storage regulator [bacterium]